MSVLDAVKSFSKKIGLIREVWINDKEGQLEVVDRRQIESLQEDLDKIEQLLGELGNQIDNVSVIEEVKQKVLSVGDAIKKGNVEVIARISTIFDNALTQIDEMGTLNIREFKEQARGGDISTIFTKGYESQPKENENNIGGAIISRKNKEYGEELTGEHIKKDKVIEMIKNMLDEALREVEDIEKGNSLDEQEVSQIIKRRYNEIFSNVKRTAKQIAVSQIKGEAVSAKTILTKRAVALILAGTLAVGVIGGVLVNKNEDYSIPVKSSITYTIEDQTDELINTVIEDITLRDSHMQNALKEANDNGSGSGIDPELESRPEATKSTEELEQYKANIEQLKKDYANISKPSNKEFIELQQKILEEQLKIIDLSIEVKNGDKEALRDWINENNEHIPQITDQPSIDEHEKQNDNSKMLIDTLEDEINDMSIRSTQNSDKIKFYSEILKLQHLEEIENIEDISEVLYEFSTKYKVAPSDLVQNLNDMGANLNLFSEYAKHMSGLGVQDIQSQNYNLEGILAEYGLLENTYKEYVEQYKQEPDYSKYTNYYWIARQQYMEELGKGGNYFQKFSQMLEQNNMNKRYYEQTTGEKEGMWEGIQKFFGTLFDVSRSGEYNETTQRINELGEQTKANQDKQQGEQR